MDAALKRFDNGRFSTESFFYEADEAKASPGDNLQNDFFFSSKVNPSVSNEFATAAFRFGHSGVNRFFERFDSNKNNLYMPIIVENTIFQTDEAYNSDTDGLESIFRGMLNDHAYLIDLSVINDLQNRLPFPVGEESSFRDLAALNIQRGRDHGLPSYKKYREFCGLKSMGDFSDFFNFDFTSLSLLKKAYE